MQETGQGMSRATAEGPQTSQNFKLKIPKNSNNLENDLWVFWTFKLLKLLTQNLSKILFYTDNTLKL